MTPNHGAEPKLNGTVEVDETFVGPKAKRKTPVVALVERHGLARVKVIASVTQKNLGAALCECVSKEAVVNTDEHPAYKNPLKHWKEHQTVNHSRGEYQRQNQNGSRASTNTAESFFRCSNAPSLALGIIFLGSTCPDMPTNSLSAGTRAMTVMASGWKGLPDASRANG
jgi:hypothetical protein